MKAYRITTIRGHSFCAGLLNWDSVVVDLGAHKGEFSSEVAASFGCKCHSVEALPALYSKISDEPLVQKYNFAMAGSDGPAELFVSNNLEGSTIAGNAVNGSDSSLTVDGVTLQTFMARAGIDAIDLLKIDIEGAEIGLFAAASDDTLANVRQITVEFHDFLPGVVGAHQVLEIKSRLQGLGFFVIKFSRSMNTDVLFVNRRLSGMSRMEYWYLKYIVKYVLGISRILRKHAISQR